MFGKSDNGFLMITQCIAPEYPQAFDSESTFNNLTEFLKHENDTVCKLVTSLLGGLYAKYLQYMYIK